MSRQTLFAASATFEAARLLDGFPAGHRSRRLHGHGFLANVRCDLPAGWSRFAGGEVDLLRDTLQSCVAQLDYRLLNEYVLEPTDESLARWVRASLDMPGVKQVDIQSTSREGVSLDASGEVHVWRRYVFQSAHRLPNVPTGHKCGRMHGHGFEAVVHANRSTGGHHRSVDHARLDELWAPLQKELNLACLNDLPGLSNPTSEILASWIWQRLGPQLPGLSRVTVYETASCGASFDGSRYRIWKQFTLDSAVRLKRAAEEDPRRHLHGHTYTLRLHLSAPLDDVMGWTVDFGDVKELFGPIFDALDHQPLYEIDDLADCDTATMAAWIFDKARERLPQLDRVDLYETRGCGVIVCMDDLGLALPV